MTNGNNALLSPGQELNHRRYRIGGTRGYGGMASVYWAYDAYRPNCLVAIKEMKLPDPSTGKLDPQEAVRLFKQEAAILGGLNYPSRIPHVYGTFEENGKHYLVMDYIEGKTLLEKLVAEGPLKLEKVLDYGIQLCDILDYLHNHHPPIIFRDLKPSNVIIKDDDDCVFLIDFGIARYFKPGQLEDTVMMGSKGFVDPAPQQTDPRSDLYSLGAVLHYCLTGNPPSGNLIFPSIRNIPNELNDLIQDLVQPNPDNRPISAKEVREQLSEIQKYLGKAAAITPAIPIGRNAPAMLDPHDAPTERATGNIPVVPQQDSYFKELVSGVTRVCKDFMSIVMLVLTTLVQGTQTLAGWLWNIPVWLFQWLSKVISSPTTQQRANDVWQRGQQAGRVIAGNVQQRVQNIAHQAQQNQVSVQPVKQGGQALAYKVRAAFSLTSPIWRPYFLWLLASLLALLFATGVYCLQVFHGSYYVVDLCLSLLLLTILLITGRAMSNSERDPRLVVNLISLALMISVLAQLLEPLVGQAVHKSTLPSQPPSFSHVITLGLFFLALLVLVGGFLVSLSQAYAQSVRWLGWIDRFSLGALTGTYALMQFLSGEREPISLGTSTPHFLATIISPTSFPLTITANMCVWLPLAVIAFFLLVRSKDKVSGGDRVFLWISMIPYLVLQWIYGPKEIHALFPTLNHTIDTPVSVALIMILLLALIFMLQNTKPEHFDLSDRVVVLLLLASAASLQDFLSSNGLQIQPFPTGLPAFTLYYLVIAVLIVITLLFFLRLRYSVNALDRVMFSLLALALAVIGFAFGLQQLQQQGQLSADADPSLLAYVVPGVAILLLVPAIITTIVIAIIQTISPKRRQDDQLNRRLRNADRMVTVGIALLSLLLLSFINGNQLLPYITNSNDIMNNPAQESLLSALAWILLLIATIVALFRLCWKRGRPERPVSLSKLDRWIMLPCSISCVVLLLTNQNWQHLPLLATNIQHMPGGTAHVLPISFLSILANFAVIIAALIYPLLFWTRSQFSHRLKNSDRIILSIVFGSVIAFVLLQPNRQLFPALLTLIIGVLISIQVERVRMGTQVV